MKKSWLSVILFLCLIMTACDNQIIEDSTQVKSPGNPTAEEIVSKNKDADIFVMDDIVFENAQQTPWVNDLDLDMGEEVLEITMQTGDWKELKNGVATKLPVGTKIYNSVEKHGPIYIAVVNGKEIRYFGLIEG